MPGSAREAYIAAFDAVEAQRKRLGLGQPDADRWGASAARFTADPRRPPDANLAAILRYIAPEHVVLDVGGGAGRYALPIALRCSEVVNIEPSKGMGEAFEASAREAGITNTRWVAADWLDAGDVEGDVSLVVNVTYFVRDVVPFIEKLVAASRERVIIATSITPPPDQTARLFQLLHGEPPSPVPSYRQLLPVLWEMGIVPDVRILHEARASALGGVHASRDAALDALRDRRWDDAKWTSMRAMFEAHFDELFEAFGGGYRRRLSGDPRMILVTWPTATP
jgi:SAM-dependent methyltransferase